MLPWFAVSQPAEFTACRQDMLLAIMRVVRDCGAEMAFPTRTVYVVPSPAPPGTSSPPVVAP